MTAIADACAGLSVEEARKKIRRNYAVKRASRRRRQTLLSSCSLCYRSGTVVEPMVSKQWFIAVEKNFWMIFLEKPQR